MAIAADTLIPGDREPQPLEEALANISPVFLSYLDTYDDTCRLASEATAQQKALGLDDGSASVQSDHELTDYYVNHSRKPGADALKLAEFVRRERWREDEARKLDADIVLRKTGPCVPDLVESVKKQFGFGIIRLGSAKASTIYFLETNAGPNGEVRTYFYRIAEGDEKAILFDSGSKVEVDDKYFAPATLADTVRLVRDIRNQLQVDHGVL